MKRTTLVLAYFIAFVSAMHAQTIIKGNVKEKTATGNLDLPFANVFVEGTSIGSATGWDGNYELIISESGTFTISYSFMGFKKQSKVIESSGNEVFTFDIILEADGETLQEVKVSAKINRESESMLLLEQKKASIAVESIGAKELSIKGVSDAGSAVTKVTGISKQEGSGTLNVRGLGDRYNTTTLNRLPLSSNNSEVKNIDLSLFPTDVIGHIDIEKTYTANLYADFGGANVNIVSKKLIGDSFFNIGVKSSMNSSVIGLDQFYLNDGPSKSGFYNIALPEIEPIANREAYNFPNNWNPVKESPTPNIGFGIDGGKSFNLGNGKLHAYLTASFENDRVFTDKVQRIIGATGTPLTDLNGQQYIYATQTNGMLNLNYSADNTQLYYNSILLNSSEQSYERYAGQMRDVSHGTDPALKTRGESTRNLIFTNQLLGEHKMGKGFSADWGVAYNYVYNTVPDRTENTFWTYDPETNTGEFDTESTGRNFRYAQSFDDNEIAANASIKKRFGITDDGYKSQLSIGYSGKFKGREFENVQFNHHVKNAGTWVDVEDVDSYLNEENYLAKEFNIIVPQANDQNYQSKYGEGYEGIVNVQSGFALYEYNLGSRSNFLIGLRGESVNQEITVRSIQIGGVKTYTIEELKILPSLSYKFSISDNQNLRFAASKTYVMPQLQEMPLMTFFGITDVIWGNPYLKPSDVYNADLKYEYFPKTGGMFSVTVYGKYILEPMNRFVVAGTQNEYVNANTGQTAHAYGIELDGRKDLLNRGGNKIFASGNLSLMKTQTDLDQDKIREDTERVFNANFYSKTSDLQGAAPVLANLSLGYLRRLGESNSISSVVVYNYISKRLYAIGQSSRGYEYDQAIGTLDFVIKSKFGKVNVDFSAKNLLDPAYERVQENRIEEHQDHVIRSYKKGISYSLSVKYNF